jgi:hypothetical protein
MKTRTTLACLAGGLAGLWLSAAALATSDKDCDRPHPPKIPDGKIASDVDMIGAKERTKLYLESADAFFACLDEAQRTVTETGRDVKIKRIDRKREEVEKERNDTLAKFNEQVRIFKLRTEPAGEGAQGSAPAPAQAPAPDPKPR